MSSSGLVPREGGTPEVSLAALGVNFSLDDVIVKGLIKEKIANLQEFRFFFHDGAQVETWVTKLGVTDDKMVQIARLRRAWAAVSLFYQTAEQDRSKVQTTDLDSMLNESELRDSKTAFWLRYRLKFPTEVHPADTTVSRVSRELSKRMLCVFNLWKVKTLQFQLTTNQKKRKLGENLYTEEVDEDEPCQHNVESYLDRLYTLMLAYAIAEVAPPSGTTPDATKEAALGADSTEFAAVPLDVCMTYWFRAKRTCYQVHPSKRMVWLQARDQEERAEWTSRFRESTLALGVIIKEVFQARDAHWIPPVGSEPSGASTAMAPVPNSKVATAPASPNKLILGKSINGKRVAKVMRDGTTLCQGFQRGDCKQKGKCTAGAHRCGVNHTGGQSLWRAWAWGPHVPIQHQGVKGPRRGGGSLFWGRFSTYAATVPPLQQTS